MILRKLTNTVLAMLKQIFILLALLTTASNLQAQEIEWKNNFGGSGDDGARHVVETTDGAYIIVGESDSNDFDVSENKGSSDLWLFKIDTDGNIIWERSYGGSSFDGAYHILASNDGNYIIAANVISSNGDIQNSYGDYDGWLIKIDPDGNLLWSKNYGGSGRDIIRTITPINNGYLAVGSTTSTDEDLSSNNGIVDVWVMRLTLSGEVIWSENYGGSAIDRANHIIQRNDNSFVITAYSNSSDGDITNSLGKFDNWIFTIDGNGTLVSEKSIGGSEDDYLFVSIKTIDNGLLVGGSSFSSDGDVISANEGAWIYKMNENLEIQWEKTFGSEKLTNVAGLVANEDDSYYAFSGYKDTGFDDYGLLKLDGSGETIFVANYGGEESDIATSMIQTTDGGPLLIGYSRSDDGNVDSNYGKADFWIIKMVGDIANHSYEENSNQIDIYPNPSDGQFEIRLNNIDHRIDKIVIYNVLGQRVYQSKFTQSVDLHGLPNGSYILRLQSEKRQFSRMIQILK